MLPLQEKAMAEAERVELPRLLRSTVFKTAAVANRLALPYVVGATGFELATSCSQSRRSARLSYAPMYTIVRTQLDLSIRFSTDAQIPRSIRSTTGRVWVTPRVFLPVFWLVLWEIFKRSSRTCAVSTHPNGLRY